MASPQQTASLANRLAYMRGELDPRPPYVALEPFARWARGLVAVCGALAAVGLGVGISQIQLLFQPATGEQALQLARAAQDATGGVLRGMRVALFLAMAGAFLTWVFHLRANVRALGVRRPRWSRVWAVAAFLVPGLNLVRPHGVIDEIWRASCPASLDPFEWQDVRAPALVRRWWVAVLVWVAFGALALLAEWSAGVVVGRLRFAASLSLFADLAACAAAALTFTLVSQLSELQRAKWERMSRPADADAAPFATARPDAGASIGKTCDEPGVTGATATRFGADTALQRLAEGRFGARIGPGGWVAAGPDGGYLTAILLRALAAALDDPSGAPQSLSVHYTARPIEGAAEIATRVERRGRSLTTVSARLTQGGRLVARAVAAFAPPQPDSGALPGAAAGPEL